MAKVPINQAKIFNVESYFCYKCYSGYISETDFDSHFLIDHDGLHSCFRCNLIFFHHNKFKKHIRKFHNIKHVCSFCPEAYNGMMYRKNDAETRYQCIYCHKVFATSNKLYNHLRLHSKPFTCMVCAKKFNTKGPLQLHLVKKHHKKPCHWLPSFTNIYKNNKKQEENFDL